MKTDGIEIVTNKFTGKSLMVVQCALCKKPAKATEQETKSLFIRSLYNGGWKMDCKGKWSCYKCNENLRR